MTLWTGHSSLCKCCTVIETLLEKGAKYRALRHRYINFSDYFTGCVWSSGKNTDYFSSIEDPRRNFKTKRLNLFE